MIEINGCPERSIHRLLEYLMVMMGGIHMASSRSELQLGPFHGGINNYSDMSAIADQELVDCVNFDIDLDGSLKTRPPWSILAFEVETSAEVNDPDIHQAIIGTFVYGGVRFIIYVTNMYTADHSDEIYIYYVDGVNAGTRALIQAGSASKAIRYSDDI